MSSTMPMPSAQMAIQPTPVGAETMTSMGLCPTPLAVCSTNQGSSQASSMSSTPPTTTSQNTEALSARLVCVPVSGRSTLAWGSAMSDWSGTVGHPHAEQSAGPQGQHQDQHGEDDRVAPLPAQQVAAEDVNEPDEETAQAGAEDVADAAQHGGGEGDDAEAETQVPLQQVVVDGVDDRARGGQRRADEEGHRDGAVDVDAAEQRGVAVLRGGPHRLAHAREAHEELQHHHHHHRDEDHEELGPAHPDRANG